MLSVQKFPVGQTHTTSHTSREYRAMKVLYVLALSGLAWVKVLYSHRSSTVLFGKFKRTFNPLSDFFRLSLLYMFGWDRLEMKVFCQINTVPSLKNVDGFCLGLLNQCERHFDIWPLEITVKIGRKGAYRRRLIWSCCSDNQKRKVCHRKYIVPIVDRVWNLTFKKRCFSKLSYRQVVLCDSQLACAEFFPAFRIMRS